MDYEKKYKEALERAKAGKPIDEVFPELKESEDERIRKMLVDHFSSIPETVWSSRNTVTIKEILAWLEKQKEQKPSEWSDEDEKKWKGLIDGLERRMGFGWASDPFSREEYIDWLKSLHHQPKKKEQKPIQTPRWMIDFLNEHRRKFGSYMDYDERKEVDGKLLCIKEWLEGNPNIWKKPLCISSAGSGAMGTTPPSFKLDVKPAGWIEGDKINLEETLYFIREFQKSNRCKGERDMQNSVTCENWLKGLRNRFSLQPKQEWSEEDEKTSRFIAEYLERLDRPTSKSCLEWLNNRLKFLRPKNHWKPSEEQMDWLESAVRLSTDKPRIHGIIISLYEQLKRL